MHPQKLLNRGRLTLISALALLLSSGPILGEDLGPVAADKPQTVSIILKLRREKELEHFIARSVAPHDWAYRDFLSTEQFADRFGPTDWEFATVLHFIKKQHIAIEEVYANRLVIRATGTTAQFNALLDTEIHEHRDHGTHFQKPSRKPCVPKEIKDLVLTVLGLDSEPAFHPHSINANRILEAAPGEVVPAVVLPAAGAVATGVPGSFTVGDVANLYNINPLYKHHITGKGQVLGITTLATFDPADAYGYWTKLGLKVDPTRIKQIQVDGGAGTNGSGETTLDVQQSGGVAYDAKIHVYEAPNTNAGFVDALYLAFSKNKVDSMSISWGLAEAFKDDDTVQAFHQAFLEAAAQGIPVFAASGDAGAFDVNRSLPTPFYSPLNSVDHPASDPYVTAAGGTTLPIKISMKYGTVVVPQERPWGWDYLKDYYVSNYGQFAYDYNLLAVGGGGGVSFMFPIPTWQHGVIGTQTTPADFSTLYFYPHYTSTNPDTSDAVNSGDLPVGYAGRNVPDVSLNADPFTGYLSYEGGTFYAGSGGTSFVAPQLNGIAALLSQSTGSRLGCLNPQFYELFRRHGYGPRSPFKAITTGDNQYWQAGENYNPASGLGTLDVTKLAQLLDR